MTYKHAHTHAHTLHHSQLSVTYQHFTEPSQRPHVNARTHLVLLTCDSRAKVSLAVSQVWPSAHTTGSRMMSSDMGQRKPLGTGGPSDICQRTPIVDHVSTVGKEDTNLKRTLPRPGLSLD